ncbi:uncharacterized protein UTRI_01051_B [Ustilago trichophora]|uniref:WD40 repeat-like protein n=1 Tax=Ustilago trichophora TaxID=86804 RepID=A0A5C3DT99_9BASI|nr:uncharacterized protein UTRI_01051_B [Ustilago trichophora]
MSLQFLSDKETHHSHSHTAPIVSVCWTRPTSSSSQGVILSGDCKGNIKTFEAQSALAYTDLPKAHSNAVHCITANAAGTVALSSAIDGTIALWDLTPFFSADDENSNDNETEAVSQEPSLLPLPLEEPNQLILGTIDSLPTTSNDTKLSEAWATALHPTLPFFASAGAGAIVSLHAIPSSDGSSFGTTLATATPPASIAKQKDLFALSLTFHPSGNLLAIGTNTGIVLLYTISSSSSSATLQLVCNYADHPSPIRALSFTPYLLLVGSDDRSISVHDIKHFSLPSSQSSFSHTPSNGPEPRLGGTVASLSGHKGWILALAAAPKAAAENVFASVAADKSIKFWDLAAATKSTPVWNGGETQMIRAFAFQPANENDHSTEVTTGGGAAAAMTRFVTASEDGKLRWYRGADLDRLFGLQSKGV